MAFVVIYDANVLFPNTLRDLLIRIAQGGLVQAKWTDEILDETFRNVQARYPHLAADKLARVRALMNTAVRDCLVTGYESLVAGLDLPDRDDRHVLAAAIKANAQVVVTNNLRDFPPDYLASWNIEAKDADAFVLDQIDLCRSRVDRAIQQIADSRRNPPESFSDVLTHLEHCGLIESVVALRS